MLATLTPSFCNFIPELKWHVIIYSFKGVQERGRKGTWKLKVLWKTQIINFELLFKMPHISTRLFTASAKQPACGGQGLCSMFAAEWNGPWTCRPGGAANQTLTPSCPRPEYIQRDGPLLSCSASSCFWVYTLFSTSGYMPSSLLLISLAISLPPTRPIPSFWASVTSCNAPFRGPSGYSCKEQLSIFHDHNLFIEKRAQVGTLCPCIAFNVSGLAQGLKEKVSTHFWNEMIVILICQRREEGLRGGAVVLARLSHSFTNVCCWFFHSSVLLKRLVFV